MFEVVVGLSCLTLILLVTSIMVANRYLGLHQEVRTLERYSEDLKRSNEDLKYSVKALKVENDRLYILAYSNPELEKMTALKLSLHLKQEEIDDLKEKLRRQNVLLRQKWEGSKK